MIDFKLQEFDPSGKERWIKLGPLMTAAAGQLPDRPPFRLPWYLAEAELLCLYAGQYSPEYLEESVRLGAAREAAKVGRSLKPFNELDDDGQRRRVKETISDQNQEVTDARTAFGRVIVRNWRGVHDPAGSPSSPSPLPFSREGAADLMSREKGLVDWMFQAVRAQCSVIAYFIQPVPVEGIAGS